MVPRSALEDFIFHFKKIKIMQFAVGTLSITSAAICAFSKKVYRKNTQKENSTVDMVRVPSSAERGSLHCA